MIDSIIQNRFSFLILIIWISMCLNCSHQSENLPNIIILLADDLGYGDLGCYGGQANTPNLDGLATEGIRFTHFYSAAPNCSPARAGLLTGRDPSKVGVYNYLPGGHPMHLQAEEVTIAEIVKRKGYVTAHFGKWHLSNLTPDYDLGQPQPDDQGFDYSLGTTNNAQPSHLNPVNFVRNGVKTGPMEGYSCHILVDEAIQWLEDIQPNKHPFLMYIAFHEPHKKVASPPQLVAKYDTFPKQDAEYLANVENMDLAIGRILDELDERLLDENTMIIFASDNGSYRNGSNGRLLGGKSFVYEGGIRVPGIIKWTDRFRAGQEINTPVNLIDVMPTVCSLTGIQHPNFRVLDGVDISPLWDNKPIDRPRPMSWFFYRTTPEIAMRMDNLVILGRSEDTIRVTHPTTRPDMDHIKNMTLNKFELYDLSIDPGQEKNLFDAANADHQNSRSILVDRLKEVQQAGPYWNNLPEDTTTKKLKSEWRQLKPTGFSN